MNVLTATPSPAASRRSILGVAAICLLYIAAVLPVLGRLEFFDGVEHFNLATVQEMRRNEATGRQVNWMLPELQGHARTVKPPLTAWLSAMLVRQQDVTALATPDAAARVAAFERFVFRSRLPTLFCSVLLIIGAAVMASAVTGDSRAAVLAAVVVAGSAIFFQQSRRATTDLQLALWVTWTQAFLALAMFRGRAQLGLIGAGISLGLASMAKGPHIALLMTLVPVAAYAWWRRPGVSAPKFRIGTIVLAVVLAIAIGLWWYAYVAATVENIGTIWWREITRKNAQVGRNVMADDPWYAYTSLFGLLLPWTGWVVLGAVWTIRDSLKARVAALLPLLWVVLPILVMSLFSEKKDRYLLPFIAPAAALAAGAILKWWDDRQAAQPLLKPADRIAGMVAGALAVIGAAVIVIQNAGGGAAGSKGFRTFEDLPWFSVTTAVILIGIAAAVLATGILWGRRRLSVAMGVVLLVAWLGQEIRLRGRQISPGDPDDRPQRLLAQQIWEQYPNAEVYSIDPVTQYGQLNRPAIVLSMELSRIVKTWPPETIQPAGVPRVLITDYVKKSPDEADPGVPASFRRLAVLELRKGKRYVDVLP